MMAKLHGNGFKVPMLFPIDKSGFVTISSLHLRIRFGLQQNSVWVESKVYDLVTLLFIFTICENSQIAEDGSIVW